MKFLQKSEHITPPIKNFQWFCYLGGEFQADQMTQNVQCRLVSAYVVCLISCVHSIHYGKKSHY